MSASATTAGSDRVAAAEFAHLRISHPDIGTEVDVSAMARAMDETWPDLDRLWGDSTMTDAATVQTMFAAAADAFPAGCSSLAPILAVSAARRCRMPLTRSATASPDAGADDHVVAIATTSLWDAPCVHWGVAPSVRSILFYLQGRRIDVLAVQKHLPRQRRHGLDSCIRLRIRRKVDLPHPEGPISAVTVSGYI